MMPAGPRVVVLGTLNTDISVVGVPRLPGPDEDAFGRRLAITAGGKARNAAEMLARLLGAGSVAFIGRTARDPFGLWRVPYDALRSAGVDTRFVRVGGTDGESGAPAVALLAVDVDGRHSSAVNTEPASSLSEADIEAASPAFQQASGHGGLVAMSLEMSGPVARHAVRAAARHSLKVVLDPGGWTESAQYVPGFARDVFLIKPNALEAWRLTGVEVSGLATAEVAAGRLRLLGVQNVLITDGANGAYLFGDRLREHIEAPGIKCGEQPDSTGCGDQVMAALCALLCGDWGLADAARLAVRAGTMQFYRTGVQPLSLAEIMAAADLIGPDSALPGRRVPAARRFALG
jgi:ribokinase